MEIGKENESFIPRYTSQYNLHHIPTPIQPIRHSHNSPLFVNKLTPNYKSRTLKPGPFGIWLPWWPTSFSNLSIEIYKTSIWIINHNLQQSSPIVAHSSRSIKFIFDSAEYMLKSVKFGCEIGQMWFCTLCRHYGVYNCGGYLYARKKCIPFLIRNYVCKK